MSSQSGSGYVGDDINSDTSRWTFEGDVAKTFDAHVSRSVPGYHDGHRTVAYLSDFFINGDNPYVVDLGCSTGSLLYQIASRHSGKKNIKYCGIDTAREMIEQAKTNPLYPSLSSTINFLSQPFYEVELPNPASLIVAYYTMQFVHPSIRQQAYDWVYQSLSWGGAFILFEKIRMPDARSQDYLTQAYNDYKLDNGYTKDQILSKSASLKGILEPFSDEGNLGLLSRAGFVDIAPIFQNLLFKGYLVIK